jgi:hypothetical protein
MRLGATCRLRGGSSRRRSSCHSCQYNSGVDGATGDVMTRTFRTAGVPSSARRRLLRCRRQVCTYRRRAIPGVCTSTIRNEDLYKRVNGPPSRFVPGVPACFGQATCYNDGTLALLHQHSSLLIRLAGRTAALARGRSVCSGVQSAALPESPAAPGEGLRREVQGERPGSSSSHHGTINSHRLMTIS